MKKYSFITDRDDAIVDMLEAGTPESELSSLFRERYYENSFVVDDLLDFVILLMEDRGIMVNRYDSRELEPPKRWVS